MNRKTVFPLLLLPFTLFLAANCSSDDSGSSSASENGLSGSYPVDLAITSPYGTGNAVEGLLRLSPFAQSTSASEPATYESKRQAIAQRLAGSAANECGFSINLFQTALAANCYGPSINFTGHPNANACTPAQNASGMLPSGDLGIWQATEQGTDEACLSRKINSLVTEVQGQVDFAVNLVTAMLCMANVKGSDQLPGVGVVTDFKTDVQEGLDAASTPIMLDAATLGRGENNSEGKAVYNTVISGSATVENRSINTSLNMKHVPDDANNNAYKGQLYYTISGDNLGGGNNCGAGGPKMFAVSVLYNKDADGALKYRLQRASYCNTNANPFDANNLIDGASLYDPNTNPDGWSDNYNDATFNINTNDGSGTYSYAWQAGRNDGFTRSILASLTAGDNGAVSGCGYYGFGPSSASPLVGTQLSGMICNWAGPCNTKVPLSLLQKQCVSKNTTTGIFESSSANITYAPTNNCDSAGAPFTYDGPSGSVTTAVTNDLVPLSDASSITAPTKPDLP